VSPTGNASASGSRTDDPIRAARALVRPQARRRPWIYWSDLTATMGVGWIAFVLAGMGGLVGPRSIALMVVAALALYRGVMFTHEIVHTRSTELPGFALAWMVTCGVPLLLPTFTYDMHRQHHTTRLYATAEDGEYLRDIQGGQPLRSLGMFAVAPLALPALVVRFAVITPLAWCLSPVRAWADVSASSLVLDTSYQRRRPVGRERMKWTVGEAACLAWIGAIAVLLFSGLVPVIRLVEAELVVSAMVVTNAFRVLGEHRYRAPITTVSFSEQVADSLNYVQRMPLAALWGPLGLRYHGVHHLFPTLPYHVLGKVLRALRADPRTADLMVVRRSLLATLPEVLRTESGAP
jgi:fatty acid desaturase